MKEYNFTKEDKLYFLQTGNYKIILKKLFSVGMNNHIRRQFFPNNTSYNGSFTHLQNFGLIKFIIKNGIQYIQITKKGYSLWKDLEVL